MKKSKNFTKQELEVLVDSVYEHKAILTSKFKSNITNEDKNRLWDQILVTNKVNSVSEVARTREAVKKKWQDFSSRPTHFVMTIPKVLGTLCYF